MSKARGHGTTKAGKESPTKLVVGQPFKLSDGYKKPQDRRLMTNRVLADFYFFRYEGQVRNYTPQLARDPFKGGGPQPKPMVEFEDGWIWYPGARAQQILDERYEASTAVIGQWLEITLDRGAFFDNTKAEKVLRIIGSDGHSSATREGVEEADDVVNHELAAVLAEGDEE